MKLTRLIVAMAGLVVPFTVVSGADAAAHRNGYPPGRVTTATYHVTAHHRGMHRFNATHHIPAYYAQ